MRYSSLNTKSNKFARLAVCSVVLATIAIGAAKPVFPDTTKCKMHNAVFTAGEVTSQFKIDISCGEVGSIFPVNTDLIAGLTLYAHPNAADFDAETARTMESPKHIGLVDEETDSYDLEAQFIKIEKAGAKLTLKFEATTADITAMRYMLFAVWKASAKKECDRGSLYARSGCKKFGYEIVGAPSEVLVDAYPGLEDYEYRDDDGILVHIVQWRAELFQ